MLGHATDSLIESDHEEPCQCKQDQSQELRHVCPPESRPGGTASHRLRGFVPYSLLAFGRKPSVPQKIQKTITAQPIPTGIANPNSKYLHAAGQRTAVLVGQRMVQ